MASHRPKRFKNIADILVHKKYWFVQVFAVSFICLIGLFYLGETTYSSAPPIGDFITTSAEQTVLSKKQIMDGQKTFHLRGLMNHGSFWGDGAERGPDFTADALQQITIAMNDYYKRLWQQEHPLKKITDFEQDAIVARIQRDLRQNGWSEENGNIKLSDAQAAAFVALKDHYGRMLTDPSYPYHIRAAFRADEHDIENLSAFFFWGAWVTTAARPGEDHSYTHNWPYDPVAGNTPTQETYVWSAVSILALLLGIAIVLYVYGQMKSVQYDPFGSSRKQSLTTQDLENSIERPTQRATYKFFALAVVLFGLQVFAGILAASDFVRPMGLYLGDLIPFSVARSYHTLFQILWFFICWIGYTIFFLPALNTPPKGQLFLINLLFACCLFVGVGGLVGIYLGQTGMISDEMSYWFGSQGWEFMELGRAFQILLLFAFSLWIFIIYRGVRPWLCAKHIWSVPAWLLYGSLVMVFFLFFSLLVTPESNFAVADFWRWMVVHMWVEVTFEVFTTVIVAYMLQQMGLINRVMAERIIFLAVMLFFLTATLGVAHNFYWIAKPTGIIALGSVFSTLQVLPLLLLTLDAWQMHQEKRQAHQLQANGQQNHVMHEVWLFILAVNFWNVFGAGVFGSLINLPIINYFEHATYLTGNHAHAAMFGVKGNIALGGMLFCCQHLLPRQSWNTRLLRTIFWSLNIGVALMMFLDLFPVGVYQLNTVLEEGFWKARTPEIVEGEIFRTLTLFRSVGGTLFVIGGVLPLIWFIISRFKTLQNKRTSSIMNT